MKKKKLQKSEEPCRKTDIVIDRNGVITIVCLYDEFLPIAYNINPEDERLKNFLKKQEDEMP